MSNVSNDSRSSLTIPIGMVIASIIISYGMYASFGITPPDQCWILPESSNVEMLSNISSQAQCEEEGGIIWCSADIGGTCREIP